MVKIQLIQIFEFKGCSFKNKYMYQYVSMSVNGYPMSTLKSASKIVNAVKISLIYHRKTNSRK